MPAGYGRGLPALESAGIELIAPTQPQVLRPHNKGWMPGRSWWTQESSVAAEHLFASSRGHVPYWQN